MCPQYLWIDTSHAYGRTTLKFRFLMGIFKFSDPMYRGPPWLERGILALNLTSEGLKYPPEVRVRHETCSTICGTHVQAILDQKNLTGLAGGVREGQIFLVQNGLYICPTYSTTCFMSNSHLWGVF